MQIFVAVAETGGFARAARQLRLSPPAVTRAVAALESRIGARLFTRTTRVVRVTEAGARFLEDCRRILLELAEAEEAAAGSHGAPRGEVALTAPVLFGGMFVTPALVEFLQRYPEVTVRAVFLDRVVNLLEEGLDLAVRIGDLPDSSLTALRVGTVSQVVCASPDYLRHHGRPLRPRDLAGHRLVAATGISPRQEWSFHSPRGPLRVRISAQLTVNTNDAAITAALAGFGLTRVLSYQVADHLAAGRLEAVLARYQPAPMPVHLVHQQGRRVSARLRALLAHLADSLRPMLEGA